jgi:DNA-binding CsgD family transcriptional regulator
LDEDVGWTAAVLASLALATRAAWTAGPWPSPSQDGPGTLVVSQTGERQSWTPGAERWLAQLEDRGTTVLRALVARLGSPATSPSGEDRAVRAHVRTPAGTWVELYGERLSGLRGDIAITLQAAHPANLAPLLMAANGLSIRERDVVRLVLDGLSTTGIAQGLFISEYTVQDHLRAIFAKVGVRTRRQLVVRLAGGPADPEDPPRLG